MPSKGKISKVKSKSKSFGGSLSVNNENKLSELERRSGLVIFEVQSITPLLFPRFRDKITICPNRVTLTRHGLFTSEEYPMAIENITNASLYIHMFTASLSIETFGISKPPTFKSLKIKDARLARRYILALIECKKAGVDLTGFTESTLKEKLKNIGMVRYSAKKRNYHKL